MAGEDDRETLSAQLGQRIGCNVYNAASPDDEFRRPDPALVRSLATRIGMANGFVVVEQVERRAVETRRPRERPVRGKFRQAWSQFWQQVKNPPATPVEVVRRKRHEIDSRRSHSAEQLP
jgi:hypothetical protein